ncbi:hypothetical protein GCL60_04665 [Silvanigrella paludirubra]|uniref:Uncharacterized protein n=1 Tax=Silvanigrella paludirubra TaxID=2499159 RepID=A0A6N6VTP4_9BACT|nr:hypothetical protein [Silvanigrella paludirubra]KAB8039553.1 hypothetical protein GCL60_04665 [Silvanigrella paludirubra]
MLNRLKTKVKNCFRTPEEIEKNRLKEEEKKLYKKKKIASEVILSEEEFYTYYYTSYRICIAYFSVFIYRRNYLKYLNNINEIKNENQTKSEFPYILAEFISNENLNFSQAQKYENFKNLLTSLYKIKQNEINNTINVISKFENYDIFISYYRSLEKFFEDLAHSKNTNDYNRNLINIRSYEILNKSKSQIKNLDLYKSTFESIKSFHDEYLGEIHNKYINNGMNLDRRNFYNQFNKNLEKIALSRNYGDKFKYHIQLSPAEIFSLTASTLVDLLLISIVIVFPPVGAPGYAAAIAANAASAAITGSITAGGSIGTRLGGIIYKKGKKILKKDRYKARRLAIPEGYLSLNSNSAFQNSLPVFRNSYDYELFEMEKSKKIMNEVIKSVSKNGQYNFNMTTLFTYYINLIEKIEDLKTKKVNHHNLQEDYMKLMNYYRYTLILKQPLQIQIETVKLNLYKSISLLFETNSSFSEFLRIHVNRNPNNYETIKKSLKKHLKIDNKEVRESFARLIFDSMITGELSIDKTNQYLKHFGQNSSIDIRLRDIFIKSESDAYQAVTKPGIIATKVVGPIYFKNINVDQLSLSAKEQINGINAAISAGGILVFNIISSLISDYASENVEKRYEIICKVMSGAYSALNVVQAGTGVVKITDNFIHFISDSLTHNILSSFAIMPFKIIFSMGVSYVTSKIDEHEQKFWNQLMEKYIIEKRKRDKVEPGSEQDKFWRPCYDFYKENRNYFPTRYMKAITELQDKRLENISKLMLKINNNINELMELTQKYNTRDKKYYNPKENNMGYMPESEFNDYKSYRLCDTDEMDKIIYTYTKIIIRMFTVAKEIQIFEDYLKYFVDGFLQEVDISLQLYMPLLKVENSKVSELIHFASHDDIYRSFFKAPKPIENNKEWEDLVQSLDDSESVTTSL